MYDGDYAHSTQGVQSPLYAKFAYPRVSLKGYTSIYPLGQRREPPQHNFALRDASASALLAFGTLFLGQLFQLQFEI